MGFRETVTTNLDALSNSTVVSVDLATLALQEGLVTQEEFEILTAPVGPGSTNYNKATFLYTKIVHKWTQPEFDVFLSVLERSGNARAVEILRSSGGKCFIDILTKIRSSNGAGSFEGYLLEDELHANKIVTHLKNTGFNLTDTIPSGKSEVFEQLHQLMSSGKVWWNGSKPQLPQHYIKRRVFNQNTKTPTTTLLDLVVPKDNNGPDWTKWDDHVLVLLVDSPGMGKSCALTKLEQELRKKLDKSPRIIIRINLNSVGSGVGESAVENGVKEVIRELFHPLKNISTGEEESPVYVLLDGLDEVLPQNPESVLSVIRFLLSDKSITKEWVIEKVVLTTRPHLKEIIEAQFNVRAYSLVALSYYEQVDFIYKWTGRSDAQELLNKLSWRNRDLKSNPLMLSMYCSALLNPSSQSNSFDEYEIYREFMMKTHELHITDKTGRSRVPYRVLKQILTNNVPFYNCLAIQQILGEDKVGKIIDLTEKAGKPELIRKVSSREKKSELISFGVVMKQGEDLEFVHRSFAEFFYAKLMADIDNTPGNVRNALFALGYNVDNNVAMFVSCLVEKDRGAVQFVSKGWTQFVPEGQKLDSYVEEGGILSDHIIYSTIDFHANCPRKVELLVRDVYKRSSVFVPWLSQRTDQTWVRNVLLYQKNTMILAALEFSVDVWSGRQNHIGENILTFRRLCYELWMQRITSMPLEAQQVLFQDILRDTRHHYERVHPCIFTWLASVFSREKLHHLIVNEETRVTDLIAHTGLRNVSFYLGNEFLPNKLLKYRFKFGEKKGKSLFNRDFKVAQQLMERVWEEIGENIEAAVQVVQDDRDFEFIRHLENNLRSFEGFSELRERRRGLLIDILAKVEWSNFDEKWLVSSMMAYGKLSLGKWEQYMKNQLMREDSLDAVNVILGSLMLSALNEDRVSALQLGVPPLLVRAPLDLVRRVATETCVAYRDIRHLFSFRADLSRKLLVDWATMKKRDPVLLSDLPTAWEVFFHVDKGLAKVSREKTVAVLNEDNILEVIFKDLLQSDATLSPELRRVISSAVGLLGEEPVKGVMTDYEVPATVASRVNDLWLKNMEVGKNYIMGVVQVYLEIFHGELDPWVSRLAKKVPVPLLVVMEERARSGGGQQWINALKRAQVFVRDHFFQNLSIWGFKWMDIQYDRECDWYEILMLMLNELPQVRKKIPADYANRTQVYSDWQCSLLRVWIEVFGAEETRRRAEESVEYERFWDSTSTEMNDGELLHVAVELGCLIGVMWTAYPKMIEWRLGNNNNRTALELAEEKLGKGHEVTVYLQRMVDNLNERGFLGK